MPSLEERLAVLSPHLYDAVPLSVTAKQAGISARTAQRWLAGYRADGASALVRSGRADRGGWRIAAELVELIEGLALRRPAPQIAQVQANLDTRTVLPGDVEPTNEPIATLLDQGRSAKIRRSCRQRRRVARARAIQRRTALHHTTTPQRWPPPGSAADALSAQRSGDAAGTG